MGENNDYSRLGLGPEQVFVRPTGNLARINDVPREDDIEVIDLDDPRSQIKPTTWHR